jgi:transcriptional regulator
MYTPAAFAESDLTKLHDFIEQNSFGTLVSQIDERPFASHVPFLLERQSGPHGTLIGHLARANPQWESPGDQTFLAVFSGAHAYISPTWYEADHVVPTWNYVAVHVYGQLDVIEDRAMLLDLVQRMVQVYERGMPRPWSFATPSTFVDKMLAQIVGFRIRIERIEGKWKLNQNHPIERRKKVVQALRERPDENSQAVAEMMAKMLEG